jgi:hypothetical protein
MEEGPGDVWDRAFLMARALGKHAGYANRIHFQGDPATSIYAYPNDFLDEGHHLHESKPPVNLVSAYDTAYQAKLKER